MSVPGSSPRREKKRRRNLDGPVMSAPEIKQEMQQSTIIGLAADVLWHHRLRHHYIGYPKTVHTCGIYAFWTAMWYCATKAGDWTHAAIERDRSRIPTIRLPAYDGIWDRGAVSVAAKAVRLSPKSEEAHMVACTSLNMVPVLARLTYAYRPWFWQRHLPFKMIWLCGAALTSCISFGAVLGISESRSRLRKRHGPEQRKAE